MADPQRPKPAPEKPLKPWLEIPGVLKIGLVNEPETMQAPHGHASTGALLSGAALAAAIICGMFLSLGRRRRVKSEKT
jgi:hypothetical protein